MFTINAQSLDNASPGLNNLWYRYIYNSGTYIVFVMLIYPRQGTMKLCFCSGSLQDQVAQYSSCPSTKDPQFTPPW